MPDEPLKKKPLARVLAVEDHPDLGNLMREALTRVRIEATIITSGEAALTHLTTEIFDLILLDINLRGMNGLEVCRQLKTDPRHKHVPVIFVSGQTGAAYKAEAKRLGAVDFIEKPFELLPFLSCVMGHLKLQMEDGMDVRKWLPITVP